MSKEDKEKTGVKREKKAKKEIALKNPNICLFYKESKLWAI